MSRITSGSLPSKVTLPVSMISLPPFGMASRALIARLRMAFSISLGSALVDHNDDAKTEDIWIGSPSVRRSSSAMLRTRSFRLTTVGSSWRRRAKVSSRAVNRAPMSAAFCARFSKVRSRSSLSRISNSSRLPVMMVSRLLKSWATPPVSWPKASRRCALLSAADWARSRVTSRMMASIAITRPLGSWTAAPTVRVGNISPDFRRSSSSKGIWLSVVLATRLVRKSSTR